MVPPGSALVLVACVAALLALALDLRLIGDARAQGSQVPATWRHRWGDTTAFGAYGAVLGAGWASYVPYALTYVAFVASGIFLPFGWAVVGGAAFGLSRALVVAGGAIFPELASHLLFRARHAARVTSTLSGIACLAVAGGLLANVFSS
jgi:hypothetical protein